jgi:hypothetical protein
MTSIAFALPVAVPIPRIATAKAINISSLREIEVGIFTARLSLQKLELAGSGI